jgi:RNA polymerase sigma factor (sigma-70 family)
MTETQETFLSFVKSEYRRFVSFVDRRLDETNKLDAEDVVQDVISSIYSMIDITWAIENLSAYIFRSLSNEMSSRYQRRQQTLSIDHQPSESEPLANKLPDDIDLESGMIDQEMKERLASSLSVLNSDERHIIEACFWQEQTTKHYASENNISLNTALSRRSRAIKKLKNHLSQTTSSP